MPSYPPVPSGSRIRSRTSIQTSWLRIVSASRLAGLSRIFQSRYLLGISLLVVLLATLNTFLYMEQARLVADAFPDTAQRIRVFSALDFTVQTLALLSQIFITGRVAARLGLRFLLTAVPLAVAVAFLALAAFPVLENLALRQHAVEYTYDRMKAVTPLLLLFMLFSVCLLAQMKVIKWQRLLVCRVLLKYLHCKKESLLKPNKYPFSNCF